MGGPFVASRFVIGVTAALIGAACGRLGFDGVGTGGMDGGGTDAFELVPDLGNVTSLVPVAEVEVGAFVNRVVVSRGYAYLATSRAGAELVVVDVTDPESPREVATRSTDGEATGLAIDGDRLYVTTTGVDDNLEVFDITDRTAPLRLGGTTTADDALAVSISAGRAYVTSAAGGDDLEIFDIADPASPVRLGGIDLLPNYYVRGVAVSGSYAFTAGQRFAPIDVSNPAAPVVVGDAGFYWYAYDLVVVGDRAYGLESNNSGSEQLRIFDITDPRAPTLLGAARTWDSYARDLEIVGPYAVTVCAPAPNATQSYVEVFDVSGTGDPPLVVNAMIDQSGLGVAVWGHHVIVGTTGEAGPELLVFEAR